MNTRFAVAVHILTLLEQQRGEPVTSEYIAGSVNTNPSLVRRLVGMLTKAGLTTSQLGSGGGTLLARPAGKISLLDIYRAVDEGELFAMHRERPNPACPIGRNIQAALETHFATASKALEDELRQVTIADVLADVRKQDRRRSSQVS